MRSTLDGRPAAEWVAIAISLFVIVAILVVVLT